MIERTSIGHHEEVKQSHTPTKTSIRSGNHSKNHSPHTSANHFSPAQTVEEYNEVMKSEIAVTRRTTYRAEESVVNLEKQKKGQDHLIDTMNEEIKRLNE